MDLFEVLFILLFILFPIIEQARKKGKGQGGPGKPGSGGPGSGAGSRPDSASRRGTGTAGEADREPASAADMVPDDLWSILTGETRPRGGTGVEVADEEEPDTPWSDAGDRRSWEPDDPVEPAEADLEPDLEPVSLEYEGPEAYSLERTDYRAVSLERTDYEPVSLERPIPDSATRHRAFHDFIDRPQPKRRQRTSAIGRALRDPDSLRNAFVLAEVLGRPKGLEE